jgi:hypothetical protein
VGEPAPDVALESACVFEMEAPAVEFSRESEEPRVPDTLDFAWDEPQGGESHTAANKNHDERPVEKDDRGTVRISEFFTC